MNIPREYLRAAAVVLILGAGTGLAFWAGMFTNARIQLNESTCASIAESARTAFNGQPASAWKPAGAQVRAVEGVVEAQPIRNERGDVLERRCRSTAVLEDGRRMRFAYKAFEREGRLAYIGGLDVEGDARVFRRE